MEYDGGLRGNGEYGGLIRLKGDLEDAGWFMVDKKIEMGSMLC